MYFIFKQHISFTIVHAAIHMQEMMYILSLYHVQPPSHSYVVHTSVVLGLAVQPFELPQEKELLLLVTRTELVVILTKSLLNIAFSLK